MPQNRKNENLHFLQPEADHQESIIQFTVSWWTAPHIVEKAMFKHYYLVRKIESNKTQVLQRIRLRLFAPRQPISDAQTTPRKRRNADEINIKRDNFYARAWECEYETSIFESDRNRLNIPNSYENAVQFELANDKASTIPGTIQESSPEDFLQAEGCCDGSDTEHYVEMKRIRVWSSISPHLPTTKHKVWSTS